MPDKICPQCGANVPDHSTNCPACGAILPDVPDYQQPVYDQPSYQQPAYGAPNQQQPGQQPPYGTPNQQQPPYGTQQPGQQPPYGVPNYQQPPYGAPSQQPYQQPPYVQQPPYAPAQQGYIDPYWPVKSKVAAGVLGILLGGLGIHKFYLGKVGLGVVYLLFCWTCIPAIIGLVEGIIYLTEDDYTFQVKNQVRIG